MGKCFNLECSGFDEFGKSNCNQPDELDDCSNYISIYQLQDLIQAYRFVMERQLDKDKELADVVKTWQPEMYDIVTDDISKNK